MKKFKRILGLAVSLATGVFLGQILVIMMTEDLAALYDRGFGLSAVLLILLAVIYLAYFLQIIVHEAGHMVFALMTGYKFVSFRVLSFVLVKDGEGFHLKRHRLPGTLGQCLMEPPEMVNGEYPGMLYHMGGVIMNLIAAAVCAGLWYVLAYEWGMAGVTVMFMGAMALWGLFSALSNGIPMQRSMVSNDGYNALKLRGNKAALRALWIGLKTNAASARGVRMLDLPEEWFEMPDDEQMQNHHVAWLALARMDRLYEALRLDEAEAVVDHLMNAPVALNGLSRSMLACEKMYLEALGANRPEVMEGLRTKEQLTFMKRMKTGLTVLRARYAVAVLTDRDEAAAAQVRQQFAKVGKTFPYPAVLESESRLMDLIDQRAREAGEKRNA